MRKTSEVFTPKSSGASGSQRFVIMIEINKSTAQERSRHALHAQLVNSLRRTILSEVENVAFAGSGSPRTHAPCVTHEHVQTYSVLLALAEVTAYVPGSIIGIAFGEEHEMEPMDVTADLHLKLRGLDYLCGTRRCRCRRPITGDHIL
jgi:hypothetical protein